MLLNKYLMIDIFKLNLNVLNKLRPKVKIHTSVFTLTYHIIYLIYQ